MRSTDITSLQLCGDVGCDSLQHYMECCVDGLKTLSITPPVDLDKKGYIIIVLFAIRQLQVIPQILYSTSQFTMLSVYIVDLMCQNVADVGIYPGNS